MSAQVELKVGQRWLFVGEHYDRYFDDRITKITRKQITSENDDGIKFTWTPAEFRRHHPSLREPEAVEPEAVEPAPEPAAELKVGQRWMYLDGGRDCDDTITKITTRQITTKDDDGIKRTWPPDEFRRYHQQLRKPEAVEPTPEPFKVDDFVTVTASQAELDNYFAGAVPGRTYRVDAVRSDYVRLAGISFSDGPDVEFGHFRRATDVEIAGMLRPDAPAPTIVCTAVTYHGDVNGVLRLDGRPDHVGVQVRMANETEDVIVEVPFADAPRIGDKVSITFFPAPCRTGKDIE